MLDVDKLVVLRSVAAHGSIAAAARELKYTRSAVSQQMSALERAAGTALLIRTGNSVCLTHIGLRLLEHTERILVELRAAESTLHQSGEVAGQLRVGVPFNEGPAIMSRALTGVRKRYPQLELTLAATSDETGADQVRLGHLDMVILSQFGAQPTPQAHGLRQWVLSRDALSLCVAVEHRLAQVDRCAIHDLREEAWVLSPTSALGRLTLGVCAAAGFQPQIAASVSDIATALGLVTVGWGITVAPDLTPVGRNATVRRIALPELEASRHSVLIVRNGEQDSPEIAAVVRAVLAASARVPRDPPTEGDAIPVPSRGRS